MGTAIYLCWILFGDLDIVQKNLKLLIVAIIVISILPGVIEVIRHRRASAKAKKRVITKRFEQLSLAFAVE